MDVLLINPNSRFVDSHGLYKRLMPSVAPLGLAYIAALLENKGIEVSIIDMVVNGENAKQVLNVVAKQKPSLIGFSVLTPVMNNVRDLVQQIRSISKESKVILGNIHPSCFPRQIIVEGLADIVVKGEGELPMLQLYRALSQKGDLSNVKGICYLDNGRVVDNHESDIIEDLDSLPFPAFHLLNLDKYREFPLLSIYNKRFLPISASRGCPYKCYYCSQNKVIKKNRYRDMKLVVDEMEYMYQRFDIGYFCFTDAYFPFSESTGLEFCDEILRRRLEDKFKWCTETRVDKVNQKMLRAMKQAGAHLIMYGVETGNQTLLDRVDKKATLLQAHEAFRHTREARILSLGLFMFGLPGETKESCHETIRFAKKLDADIVKFNIAIPFPGSQFFEDKIKETSLDNPEQYTSWYSSFSLDPTDFAYDPQGLSNRKLSELQGKAMFCYYIRPKVIMRSICNGVVTYKAVLYGACWFFLMLVSSFLRKLPSKETKNCVKVSK